MKVAIQLYLGEFFITEWREELFKWNGSSFQASNYQWAKSFDSAEEVVGECKAQGFKAMGLVSRLPPEEESKVWNKLQASLNNSV